MKQNHRTETGYCYRGYEIHTSRGVHEAAIEKILESCPGGGKHVLDLGCGSGGFTRRLLDCGFTTTSVDFSLDTCPVETEAIEVDLNENFLQALEHGTYDVIVALEVIEHLENPLNFLRQLKGLMSEKTKAWISFPNIYLFTAVRSFFKNGTFVNWNRDQYWKTGHQTILTDWLFEEHLRKVGLMLEKKYFVAPIDLQEIQPIWWKRLANHLVLELICLFSRQINKDMRKADCILSCVSSVEIGTDS